VMRDALTPRTSETTEYYRYLRANTLLTPSQISPPPIDFVRPLRATADRKPNIFLIVVDSLRRDYLSPYNAQVAFTPHIGELAADSFVFTRAFTRYAGTALSVPSIWAGGMVPHMAFQSMFEPRNTLDRLLDAEGYRRVMDLDNIVQQLLPRDAKVEQLDRGTP